MAGDGLSDLDLSGTEDGKGDGVGTLSARVCADGNTIQGVDVSYYQGTIDWPRVKASGIDFAFIRVSDGEVFKDPKFATNWAGARAAGVVRGAYQFFRPAQDPIAQADLLVNSIGTLAGDDLPPVIDVEATGGLSPSTIQARVRTWVDRVTQRLGRAPIIYTGKYFWRDEVGGPRTYAEHALWIAQYTSRCPDLPDPWARWTFWQHTDKGSVPGIRGPVDLDKFNGDLAALQAFVGGAGTVPAAEAIDFRWDAWGDGTYTFYAAAPTDVARAEIRIEGYLIGAAARGGDGAFTLDYDFNVERESRAIEVRGLTDAGGLAALGTGLIDSTTGGVAVFVRQVDEHTYEIGVEGETWDTSAIEVSADGLGVWDDVTGEYHVDRLAVLHTFPEIGDRQITIRTFDWSGAIAETLERTFTVR